MQVGCFKAAQTRPAGAKLPLVKVVIHDRTEAVPPGLRAYTERKLTKLSRHFDKVQLAQVDFEQERNRSHEPERVVRIIIQTDSRKGPAALKAQERAPDMQAALDLALDKVDRQVKKLKEKLQTRKTKTPEALPIAEPAPLPAPERLKVHLKPESLEQAEANLESNGYLFHVFLDEDSGEVNVIYRRADGSTAILEPILP